MRDAALAAKTFVRILAHRRSIDVVHAQQLHAQSAGALLAARLTGRAAVLTLHLRVPTSSGLRALAQRIIDKICVLAADEIVAVSPPLAATIAGGRTRVIPNGVDVAVFRPSAGDRARVRESLGIGSDTAVVFAGRWSRTKGLDTLFRAFQQAASGGILLHLIVIGEPALDEPPILPEAFVDSAASKRVHVLGKLDDSAEVAHGLAAADAFVLPSLSEGMPLALLGALACGLPVIVSDIPVHRAIIETYECGWLITPGDASDLARVLETLAVQGAPREWASRARDAAVQHHSIVGVANSYRAAYRRAIERRND